MHILQVGNTVSYSACGALVVLIGFLIRPDETRPLTLHTLCPQIRKQRKKELRKLGHMIPCYTLMECTMVASPIIAAIASFLAFAATADPDRFTPGAIFSAVALFGILKPPIEDLPHSMVEVSAIY